MSCLILNHVLPYYVNPLSAKSPINWPCKRVIFEIVAYKKCRWPLNYHNQYRRQHVEGEVEIPARLVAKRVSHSFPPCPGSIVGYVSVSRLEHSLAWVLTPLRAGSESVQCNDNGPIPVTGPSYTIGGDLRWCVSWGI